MVRQLVLHAQDVQQALPALPDLVAVLRRLGFIGAALEGDASAFYVGDEFLSLITFLGCSPHIDIEPVDATAKAEGRFCHVRFRSFTTGLQFRAVAGNLQPRCAKCRTDVPEWKAKVEGFLVHEKEEYECKKCGATSSISALNWRQSAGFGHWFLEIWNIHPHEAVPSESLLAALEELTGTSVHFFYQ